MPNPTAEHWLKVIANLRVDRVSGIAPHQPLLLLVLADLAQDHKLTVEPLLLTGELSFRFLTYWTAVSRRRPQKPDIRLPFFYLKNSGCWTPLGKTGCLATDKRDATSAQIDPGFLSCLLDPDFRDNMRGTLVARYFLDPQERAMLYDMLDLPVPSEEIVREEAERFAVARERGREARFRLNVIPAYDYTCALTRYRLVTIDAGCIVDAAHIHPFAISRNNDPRNGIALCKNAHWMFDQGLWSLDEEYRVVTAGTQFHESGNEMMSLHRYEGQRILLPTDRALWPDRCHLDWHRKNKLAG